MIGLLAGSFIFGVLSDKIGRRHTLVLAGLTCALGNLAGAFVPNKWGYAALRLSHSNNQSDKLREDYLYHIR